MSDTLEFRPFGSTGEQVSLIGLGGAYLDKHSLADGVSTVRRALELGVTYFDTAPAYCSGASQIIMAKALEGRKEPYILATKLGASFAKPAHHRSHDVLWAQLQDNLRLLRRNQVDVLQVHVVEFAHWWKDGVPSDQLLDMTASYDFQNAPVFQVLREAKDQGLCRFIGITADRSEELVKVLRHVDANTCLIAYGYNLIFRHARNVLLPLARKKGAAQIIAGVVKQGALPLDLKHAAALPGWITPQVKESLTRLYRIQTECGLSLATLAIRYLVADSNISTILIGAATPDEIEEAVVAAQAGPLPSDLHQAIEELGTS
ncbi:MAG: aldo/keto reductase [Anaerolineales bacterium]|jgi:D-threo-aldose 1-dehydrogenase